MTHFRFRCKRIGYMRWRCRAASRRTTLLALPCTASASAACTMAAWRRTMPVATPIVPLNTVLRIGGFIVGAEGDPRIFGHPDIRY